MNILILGSGGREHAFTWKIAQSPICKNLYVAPGNAGTAGMATNLDLAPNDFEAVKQAVLSRDIGMVVVGPEDPLVAGIADFFDIDPDLGDVMLIGPSKQGAMLEGSKDFAKRFMQAHGIPTATHRTFTKKTLEEGLQYLEQVAPPYVLKADGLAAGKGVLILDKLEEARRELTQMLGGEKFGNAGTTVVIEQFLSGIELSVFVLTDGKSCLTLPTAKDYKRVGEGDTGLNTGGMGAVSPAVFADDAFMKKVDKKVVGPTIQGLQKENIRYRGFLFIGLMKVGDEPYVIEYNVRMGDPETQVVLPRIDSDLVGLLTATCNGTLTGTTLEINPKAAATVIAVSGGYPEKYQKGSEITGLDGVDNATVFHAGTAMKEGVITTNGGRVLAVTSLHEDYARALENTYQNLEKIRFDGMSYRRDIGFDLTVGSAYNSNT